MTDSNQTNEASNQPPMSFGQRAVGASFNPAQDSQVTDIKSMFAEIVDYLNNARNSTTDPEEKRMYSVAITEAQTAQMWGVKAATWNIKPQTGRVDGQQPGESMQDTQDRVAGAEQSDAA